jgi:ATP-dependent DNA helicase RecQ
VELGMIGNIDLGNANSLNPPGNKILKNVLEFLVLKNYNNTNLNDVNYNNYKQCIETQDSLENEFRKRDNGKFDFILTFEKKYPETSKEICEILNENPQIFNQQTFTALYKERLEKVLKDSKNFDDYILLLEEVGGDITHTSINENIEELRTKYSRSRHFKPHNDTGRLIYRMHCMGLIDDYIIDYNERYYKCTINRHKTIDLYVDEINKYLRRYLSEISVDEEIKKLKERLDKPTLVYNIMECLYYLAEFSEREIASKRKRATEEIEKVLNESITNPTYATDSVQQNYYIKEQVYFYFNAKYARRGYKVSDEPYSLLEDYENSSLNKIDVLQKYLNVLNIEGTAQNNYKHMIGSCKKILMSLAETTLKKEWLLRLLKAFAMYSVNNPSYISEANDELEVGFDNLYGDETLHDNNFEKIKPVFDKYFEMLEKNIQRTENSSFKDIEMIRLKLLLKMQTLGIEKFIELTQKINYI